MVSNSGIFTGIVRNGAIEIEGARGLPEGARVTVLVRPTGELQLAPGEGLRRSFGAWATEAAAVDEYLQQNREQRARGRRELEP